MQQLTRTDRTVDRKPILSTRVVSQAWSPVREIYLTVQLDPPWNADSLESLFEAAAGKLRQERAPLFAERLFLPEEVIDLARDLRQRVYRAQSVLTDEVEPTILKIPQSASGNFPAAIQIHAVSGTEPPEAISYAGRQVGRRLQDKNRCWAFLQAVAWPEAGDEASQARAVLKTSEEILKQLGGDFFSVARTWLWLRDITDWYDQFNQERSEFFRSRGLLNPQTQQAHFPASTGVGIETSNSADCVMDLVGVIGKEDMVRHLNAGGNQQSAFDYGSAFSRASWAATPAGRTLFVSGTASIDGQGTTLHEDSIGCQIKETLTNLQAVLARCRCTDRDVVSAIAYVKNQEVADVWSPMRKDLVAWPVVTVPADICRPELLFEIELTAAQPS